MVFLLAKESRGRMYAPEKGLRVFREGKEEGFIIENEKKMKG